MKNPQTMNDFVKDMNIRIHVKFDGHAPLAGYPYALKDKLIITLRRTDETGKRRTLTTRAFWGMTPYPDASVILSMIQDDLMDIEYTGFEEWAANREYDEDDSDDMREARSSYRYFERLEKRMIRFLDESAYSHFMYGVERE